MAKHQVFLIHGMGAFTKDWSLGAQQTIRNAFRDYGLDPLGLHSQFEFVEIEYNSIFEDIREIWKTNAESAAGALVASGLQSSAAERLVNLAGGASGDDFWRTHVLDVVMYRFMRQVSERVNQSVRAQILGRLAAFPQDDVPSWSVLGHSLGTAVMHDTLHGMFTQSVDGRMLGDRMKPDFVFAVANVSKVLWNKGGDFYSSRVRPHTVDSLGMCWKFCNFRHRLDPFPMVDPFRPPDYWYPDGVAKADRSGFFSEVFIPEADVQDVNVHALEHYLGHPLVSRELINTLVAFEAVKKPALEKALEVWRKKRLLDSKIASAQEALSDSKLGAKSNWASIIESLVGFRTKVASESSLVDGESP